MEKRKAAKSPSVRTYRGASSDERSATRKRKLIAAAIEVYGNVGYRAATVKAVCAAAGLTDRYFYEAFANSEALLAASFQAVTHGVVAEIRESNQAAVADQAVRAKAMLGAYFAALRREPTKARVFLVEMSGISPAIDAVFDGALDQIGQLVVGTFDPRRNGPAAQQPLIARGIARGLIGIAASWISGGYAEPIEVATDAAFALCKVAAPANRPASPRPRRRPVLEQTQ